MRNGREDFQGGAIVALVAALPADSFRLFDRVHDSGSDLDPATAAWLRANPVGCAVVHGDPRQPDIAADVARLSDATSAFLIGGLTSAEASPAIVALLMKPAIASRSRASGCRI